MRRAGLCRSDRVSTIHNGVDIDAFDALPPAQRAGLGLHKQDFVIGCFGRLTCQKNQAALLCALPRVLVVVPNARLLLVGGGEDETMLRALAQRRGIAECVVFAGDVEEARPLYALCDVVAQPSRWEGCPYTVLEALAAQRLVVARDVGGVEEILDDCYGISYNTRYRSDVESLAQWIIKAAHDANWRHNTESNARHRVEQDFTLQRMVEQTLQVYKSSLA
jgi:glycosyltransferase involved in cell wall biosynthesis